MPDKTTTHVPYSEEDEREFEEKDLFVKLESCGRKIKEIRKELKLSKQQFADKHGFTYEQVCYMERGFIK